jgi:hypothetical protein
LAQRAFARAILISLLAAPALAEAAPGPGIGNLDCGQGDHFKPISFIENSTQGPNGTNVSLMIRGYFMTIFAPDSGAPPGEIGIYDVSNPKAPVLVKHIENSDTTAFREAHSLPVAFIGGKQVVAIQTIKGIQFWDFTDPPSAKRIGSIDLPGVNGGDYENVAWQTSWQGRYLYVSGGNQGIYVVDAADPQNPKLLSKIPTSVTGGFRTGPLFALGDYMVISNSDQGGRYAVLDISVPDQPALLSHLGNQPRMYSIAVGASDRIFTAGRDGNFLIHSFEDPTEIKLVKNALIGEDQLYAAVQDHFVYLGRQNNVVKVDITNEQNPTVVGQGTLGRDHPDHGQVTPFGNLIFIGNDHGTGSAFFCHQLGRDTMPPTVQATYPKDGATGVVPEARLNVLFSDYIDTETLTDETVVVRKAGGEPLEGIYTYNFNMLSFGPTTPFEVDTTYEVVLAAGGVKDVMGNALAEETVVRFSTGDSIVVPPPPEPGTGGTGGTGGTAGGSGGAVASGGTQSTGAGPNASGGVSSGGSLGATGGTGVGGSAVGGSATDVSGGSSSHDDTSSEGSCAVSGTDLFGRSGSLGMLLLPLALAFRAARRRALRG